MKASRLLIVWGVALILLGLIRWAEPVHGLAGRYYLDESRTGDVVNASVDERIALNGRDLVERAGRSDRVGIAWEGYIHLARKTTLRFSLRSDDGSWLRIDDSLIVDNGGVHAFGGFDAEVPLDPGAHQIRIDYFNAGEEGRIDFRWRRTGILRFLWPKPRLTPEPMGATTAALDVALDVAARVLGLLVAFLAALLAVIAIVRARRIAARLRSGFRAVAEDARRSARENPPAFVLRGLGLVLLPVLLLVVLRAVEPARGLTGSYYPNVSREGAPRLVRVDRSIHIEKSDLARTDPELAGPAAAVWEGTLHVPVQSVYRFEIVSDDGSTLELDGRLLVDNGGYHPTRRAVRDILVGRGDHPIRITYFEAGDGGHIDVFIRPKGSGPLAFLSRAGLYPRPPDPAAPAVAAALVQLKLVLLVAALVAAVLFGLGFPAGWPGLRARLEPAGRSVRSWFDRTGRFLEERRGLGLVLFAAAWLLILGGRSLLPVHGLTARYYPGASAEGPPAAEETLPVVKLERADLAARAGASGPVTVVWEGFLFAPKSSDYRFEAASGDAVAVEVDGRSVLKTGPGSAPSRATVRLARGPHALSIRLVSAAGTASLDFRWSETLTPQWRMPPLRLYPERPGKGILVGEIVLPALISVLKAFRFLAGAVLVLLALGAALPRGRIFAAVPYIVLTLAAAFSIFQLVDRRSTAVEGCDTYAYLQGAEIIAREGPFRTDYMDPLVPVVHKSWPVPPSPEKEMFVLAPHGYYVGDPVQGDVINTFPPGMSMLLAPVVLAFGRGAAFWLVPVLNLLLLAAFFVLGAKAVDPVFGLGLAAAALFNEPVFTQTVLIMSDLPSLALISLSAFLLYRHIRRPRSLWPLLAGAVFGLSLLVRYSNAAAVLPLALILWAGRGPEKRIRGFLRDGALFAAAATLAGLVPLGVYTARLFGTPFRLVYDPVNVSRMSPANVPIGASYYLGSLGRAFGPLGLALAAVGLVSGLVRKATRSAALVGIAGLGAFFVFYAFQSLRQERYLIPAYPFLALLVAFGLWALAQAAGRSRLLVTLLLAAAVALPLARSFGPLAVGTRGADAAAAAVKARAVDTPVVFCDQLSGPLRLYADIPGYRFAWTAPDVLEGIAGALQRDGRTVYFLLDNPIAADRFREILAAAPGLAARLEREPDVAGMPFYRLQR